MVNLTPLQSDNTRTVRGTLSQLFGEQTLGIDRLARLVTGTLEAESVAVVAGKDTAAALPE